MTPRFFISQKKLPLAVKKALSIMLGSSDYGEISSVDFELGRPKHGRLPFRIIIDGHKEMQCEPSDVHPLLDQLRDWMERCLAFDRNGEMSFECVKLECGDDVYLLTLFHAGWTTLRGRAEPISGFIVSRSCSDNPILHRFCMTNQLISRLYKSITWGIIHYSREFNDERNWYYVKRYDRLDPRTTSDHMLARIHSDKLERIVKMCKNYPV